MIPPDKFDAVVRSALGLPDDFAIADDLAPEQIPGWDSFAWINIMNALQDEFHILLPLEGLAEVSRIGQLRELVRLTAEGGAA